MLKADLNVIQTSVRGELSKLSSCVQGKAQGGRDQSIRSKKGANAITIYNIEGLPVEWTPHIEGKPSARGKNPPHFPHAGGAIRKVLQPLLAKYDLEAAVGER